MNVVHTYMSYCVQPLGLSLSPPYTARPENSSLRAMLPPAWSLIQNSGTHQESERMSLLYLTESTPKGNGWKQVVCQLLTFPPSLPYSLFYQCLWVVRIAFKLTRCSLTASYGQPDNKQATTLPYLKTVIMNIPILT